MATARGERLLGDPSFAALKDIAIGLTGLHYWEDKAEALADVLAPLLPDGRAGVANLVERLRAEHGYGALSSAVIDAATVGETFFFRYHEQFDALQRVVIPEVMARNRSRRRLSVWSAGCSNGAEAYSVSILLRRQFGALLGDWHVDVLGTDVSPAAIASAERARFGAWSVRGLDGDMLRECFDAEGGLWRVKPRYRAGIRFLRHNLVTQPPPVGEVDVVLCRNVLMYFDVETQGRVLASLDASMNECGWLLVGHAEGGGIVDARFTPLRQPGCTLYRKRPALTAAGAAARRLPPPLLSPPSPPPPVRGADPADEIRRLLDGGDDMAAVARCQAWVTQCPLDPAPHYFLGVAQEARSEDEAVGAFRRALFLSPHLAMAHFQLLRLFLRRGERRAARRHHAALLADLAALPPTLPVPLSGGVTAQELAAVVRRLERGP